MGEGRGIREAEGFMGAPHLNLPRAPLFLDPPLHGAGQSRAEGLWPEAWGQRGDVTYYDVT